MIAVPLVSEAQVRERLQGLGYEPTEITVATGRFWRNKTTGRHLLVPNPSHETYPSWILDELISACAAIGDMQAAAEIATLTGWQRLTAKPKNDKKSSNGDDTSA